MASTKTYTLATTGDWTAAALDSTGTYETSEISNSVSNATKISLDMSTLSGWSSVSSGSHTLTIKAMGSGYLTSDASTGVSFTKAAVYSITATTTNVTASASNPTTITEGTTATLTFTADGTSYKVPTSMPTITGATGTYTRTSDTSCTIVLSNPTGNVSFTVVGEEVSTSETWVINSEADVSTVDFSIGFTSNSTSYSAMTNNILGSTGVGLYYDSTLAASGRAPSVSTWLNESYRTVTFSTAPTGDLLTWLQANAVKQ